MAFPRSRGGSTRDDATLCSGDFEPMALPPRLKILTDDELNSLSVDRLLAYRNKALSIENSLIASDYVDTAKNLDPEFIWFKDDPRWQNVYNRILLVLKTKQRKSP